MSLVVPWPAVVVLVGAAGSGKTTFRRRLVAAGWPADAVVSLDDARRAVAARVAASGREPLPAQRYTPVAVARAMEQQAQLLAAGRGYLADATHLPRRERVLHVRAAEARGLPSLALLLPALSDEALLARDAARPEEDRVPPDVLLRHGRRHRLLTPALLVDVDGFTAARVVDPDGDVAVAPTTRGAPAGGA